MLNVPPRGIAAALLVATSAACASPTPDARSSSAWVGTITTEGDVTTVVNESGSVWGGTATLVEVVSIGEREGDEPYLLGDVNDVGVTADRIYVLDRQVSRIRAYDQGGAHLFDVGGEGQGPGEFQRPWTFGADPVSGRLLVQDAARVSVFDLDGNFVETWPYPGPVLGFPLRIGLDGTAFVPQRWTSADGERRAGLVAVGADGAEIRRLTTPSVDLADWTLVAGGAGDRIASYVAFAPSPRFAPLPSGAVVRGTSDIYRFEIDYPDGKRTVVERVIDLPPVSDRERDWQIRLATRRMRRRQPDWTWNANPIPDHKPAFRWFFGDRHGRIWVQRIIRTDPVIECDQDPHLVEGRPLRLCWREVLGFDLFEEQTGHFLGEVELPAGFQAGRWPAFVADGFVAVVEDEAGTIMVKRYRLVLPGEEQ